MTSGATRINFLVLKPGRLLRRYLLPVSAFLLPFALYFSTTARDIFWLDSAEFLVVTAINGLTHPPGYPLLLWMLKAASLIPVFALPFRLNLISALFAALSCFVLFLFLKRLTREAYASLLGALVWATSFELWQQATAIEVYSLQVLLVGLALFAVSSYAETGSGRMLLLLAFALGLGFANHLFVAFWVPGVAVILYSDNRQRLHWQTILIALLLFLLGPLLYLSLFFRTQDPPSWAGIDNLNDLLSYVTARIYRYRFLAGGTGYLATQFKDLSKIIFQQFTIFWLLLIPGIIGMLKNHRRVLFGLLTGVLIAGPAVLLYNIPDKEGYFLPIWFICALIIGYGIHYVARAKPTPVTITITILIIAQTVYFYPRQDRSQLTSLSDLAQAVKAELPANAVLFTDDYSLFHGMNWLNLKSKPEDRILVVSQYHLTLPWYLKQLAQYMPVPAAAFAIAENLWSNPVRTNDIRFGETARRSAEEIMATLISGLTGKRVFYFPQNFTSLLENWQGWRLSYRGLTYEFVPPTETALPLPESLQLPGPDRYNTARFYDLYTIDLCRRFAAAMNRRGMLKYARGDAGGAIADFNRSLEYYPDYPSAIENKGLVFAFEGRPDSARHYLRHFLELEPNSPESEKVKLILSRLSSY